MRETVLGAFVGVDLGTKMADEMGGARSSRDRDGWGWGADRGEGCGSRSCPAHVLGYTSLF